MNLSGCCTLISLLLVVAGMVATAKTTGSRILIAAPRGTKSHTNSYMPIAKELAHRGHYVTVITNYASKDLNRFENIRQIQMDHTIFDLSAVIPNPFKSMGSTWKKVESFVQTSLIWFTLPASVAETLYSDPRIQDLIAHETFDLVMVAEVCGHACVPFGWFFQAPVISISPNVLIPGRAELIGDDENLSYVPFFLSSFTDQMSLSQRMMNFVFVRAFIYFFHHWPTKSVELVFQSIFNRPEAPSYVEMEKNISLLFTNSNPAFAYPRSMPPQVIEVGGIHCRPANPLPLDLEAFVSSETDGFIIFGVGSALKMDDMPEETVQAFIKVFARLPQRVIWQWKGKVRSDLPSNVLAIPWLPQQDLLGHPNCRAFLTHGGLNSLQEAIFHGVPVLGLPLGSDQNLNIGRAIQDGYALKLEWTDITEETLSLALDNLLNDPKYDNAAERLAIMFRDQFEPPLQRAVFWTEFLLRHQGAEHLRLGSINLTSYQRALFDVYLVLALVVSVSVLLSYLCVRKCCCGRKRKLRAANGKKGQ